MGTKTSPEVAEKLQQYKSHKIVAGAEILSVDKSGIYREQGIDCGEVVVFVKGVDGEPVELRFNGFWCQRNEKELTVGNYVVVYSDGYTSISPKAAFEEGYHTYPSDLTGANFKFSEGATSAVDGVLDALLAGKVDSINISGLAALTDQGREIEDAILARADAIRAGRNVHSVTRAYISTADQIGDLDNLIAAVPDEKTRAAMLALLNLANAMGANKRTLLALDDHDPDPQATIALVLEEFCANTADNVKKATSYAKQVSELLGTYLPYGDASSAGSAEVRAMRLQILEHLIRNYIEVMVAK